MPTKTKISHIESAPPTVPHPHRRRCTPLEQIALDLITGLPPNGTLRLHTDDRRSWVLPRGCIPTLRNNSNGAREWPSCTSTTYIDGSDYPRRSFRIETLASPHTSDALLLRKIGAKQNLSTAFHPQNRRTLRTEESMGRAIPSPHRQCATRGLEPMAHGGQLQFTMTTSTPH